MGKKPKPIEYDPAIYSLCVRNSEVIVDKKKFEELTTLLRTLKEELNAKNALIEEFKANCSVKSE